MKYIKKRDITVNIVLYLYHYKHGNQKELYQHILRKKWHIDTLMTKKHTQKIKTKLQVNDHSTITPCRGI